MQIEALRMFCDVVSHRSFSRAADANQVSQSSASQMVHQLEDRLAVKLIDRSKRPFVLTPEGELFYRECRKLIGRYESLIDQVQNLHVEVSGRVRIASIYSVGLSYLNHIRKSFFGSFPQIDLQVEFEHPNRVYEQVESDQADLGLVSYAKSSRTLDVIPWFDEPMIAIASSAFPIPEDGLLHPENLGEARFVAFDKDLMIRREIDRSLGKAGATSNVAMEFDNIETIKRAVIEIEDGVAIVPEPTVRREVDAGLLKMISIPGCRFTRPLGIIHRRGRDLSRAARRFVDFLHQQKPEATPSGTTTLGSKLTESTVAAD